MSSPKNILQLSVEAATSKRALIEKISRLETELSAARGGSPAAISPRPAAVAPASLALSEIEERLANTTDPRERFELARLANESAGHVSAATDPAAVEKALEVETDPRRRFELAQSLNLAAGFHR